MRAPTRLLGWLVDLWARVSVLGAVGFLTFWLVRFKMTGDLDWPWWAVLAPVWGGALFGLGWAVAAAAVETRRKGKEEGHVRSR